MGNSGMVSFDVSQPTLNQMINSLDVLLDEVTVAFGEDALHANGVDPADVAMINLTLTEDAFESYDGDETGRGVDLERLGDIVGMADSSDVLSFEEEDTGRFEIEFSGLSYTMAMIDPGSIRDGQEVPSLDWDSEFTVTSDLFKRGCTAADMVSDHIELSVEDETAVVAAEGDTDEVTLDASQEENIEVDFSTGPEGCDAIFSLDYLSDIVRALPSGEPVRVSMGDDLPVVITADLADGEGEVTYVLAPRIQD